MSFLSHALIRSWHEGGAIFNSPASRNPVDNIKLSIDIRLGFYRASTLLRNCEFRTVDPATITSSMCKHALLRLSDLLFPHFEVKKYPVRILIVYRVSMEALC